MLRNESSIASNYAVALFAALALFGCALAGAQTETVLYSFGNGSNGIPSGQLASDSTGALYGTNEFGLYFGSVFKLTPPSSPGGSWTEQDLYDFKGNNHGIIDGAVPLGGVTADETGALYGTTSKGGVSNRGAVFKLSPPTTSGGAWTEAILHFFGGSENGMTPASNLLRVSSGALYGTTEAGGSFGAGTVFILNPPATDQTAWVEKILYSFTGGADGGTPSGGLILDGSGNLYGMTSAGGLGHGTIYELTRPSTPGGAYAETVLYSFNGDGDGAKPLGNLVFNSAKALYGTVSAGGRNNCGTVFELSPPTSPGSPWSYFVLHAFAGPPDACDPVVGVTLGKSGGVLYGTTFEGGASGHGVGLGTVFRLTPPAVPGDAWTEAILHDFGAVTGDAEAPDAPLILKADTLYGTTRAGGEGNGGTAFEIVP
jgi:uncharacterized repeat protein (TIGR03803 family)